VWTTWDQQGAIKHSGSCAYTLFSAHETPSSSNASPLAEHHISHPAHQPPGYQSLIRPHSLWHMHSPTTSAHYATRLCDTTPQMVWVSPPLPHLLQLRVAPVDPLVRRSCQLLQRTATSCIASVRSLLLPQSLRLHCPQPCRIHHSPLRFLPAQTQPLQPRQARSLLSRRGQ
jgi:hypothetical protein